MTDSLEYHYRYDEIGAYLAGEKRPSSVVIRELFPKHSDYYPVPMADSVEFCASLREAIDSPLPTYVERKEPAAEWRLHMDKVFPGWRG